MKKTYMTPSLTVVKLQHQSIICDSLHGADGNANLNYRGGNSTDSNGSYARTKESGNVWDEEW